MLARLVPLFSLLIVLSLLGTAGCLIVPISPFTKAPYPKATLDKLGQAGTTRNAVRAALGQPQAIRSGGRYWFYGHLRESVGIIAGTRSVVFEDFEWVGFEFDTNDRSIFVEYNDDEDGCLSNGICTDKSFLVLAPELAVMLAPIADDRAAKTSQPAPQECQLFFYHTPMSPRFITPMQLISVDGKKRGAINYKTFLLLPHPTGNATLKTGKTEIVVPCRPGENVYIQAAPHWPAKSDDDMWDDFSPVDSTTGETAIQSRRLALPY